MTAKANENIRRKPQTPKETGRKKDTIFDSRSFLLVFFFAKRCCFPALLRIIFPFPVTRNLFADALNQNPPPPQRHTNPPNLQQNKEKINPSLPCGSSSCTLWQRTQRGKRPSGGWKREGRAVGRWSRRCRTRRIWRRITKRWELCGWGGSGNEGKVRRELGGMKTGVEGPKRRRRWWTTPWPLVRSELPISSSNPHFLS